MTINGKTVGEALKDAIEILSTDKSFTSPRLDCEILLAFVLNCTRMDLIFCRDKQLSDEQQSMFFAYIQRRLKREPISYITNEKEFMSLSFFVEKGILTPRPETELLVEYIIDQYKKVNEPHILDLCTGSGAIAVSLAHYLKNSYITAVDKYDICLEVAKKNAQKHGCSERIKLMETDVLKQFDMKEKFHCIVSNPPYIKSRVLSSLPDDVKCYEPEYALDGGQDGLLFYRQITSSAAKQILPGGKLVYEIGYDQGVDVKDIIEDTHLFHTIEIIKDYAGLDRMVIATKED